jgi:hypothetical protein
MATKVSSKLRCSADATASGRETRCGPGIYICDDCVGKCVAILADDTSAETLSLPEWASMSDNELLERIPFMAASAANIEAGLRDRVLDYVSAAFHGRASVRRWA